jgi:SAM-dependent methyltransferase
MVWDERYTRGEGLPTEPEPLLVEWAPVWPPGNALDAACGAGRNSLYLARKGWTVDAIDSSPVAIELLKEKASGLSIQARVADLEHYNLPADTYHLICCCHYLQRSLFTQIKMALKPNGVVLFVIAMPDDDSSVKPMNPKYLLEPGELAAAFDGWEVLYDREVKEPGRRKLSKFIARKY